MEFKREDRYLVLKRKDLAILTLPQQARLFNLAEKVWRLRGPKLECVVVESDWPEYETVWEEIQRRVEDRPTIMDEELGRWQDAIYKLVCDLAPDARIDGGGCDSGDPLDFTLDEISQAFSYWDNLLFDAMTTAGHSYEGSTFKSAAELIASLKTENDRLNSLNKKLLDGEMPVCDECDSTGWCYDRTGRYACTCMTEAEPYQLLRDQVERLQGVIKEADEYLDTNKLTNIANGSILHQKLKDAAVGLSTLLSEV